MEIKLNCYQLRQLKSCLMKEMNKARFYSEEWEDHPYLRELSRDIRTLEHKKDIDKDAALTEYNKLYGIWYYLSNLNTGDTIEIVEEK